MLEGEKDIRLCLPSTGKDDGCGGKFRFKTSPDACAKCTRLHELEEQGFGPCSPEYQKIKAYPQCQGCGAAMKNLPDKMCMACRDELDDDPLSKAAQLAAAERAAAMAKQTKLAERMVARGNGPPVTPVVATHGRPLFQDVVNLHNNVGYQESRGQVQRSPSETVNFTFTYKPSGRRTTAHTFGINVIQGGNEESMIDIKASAVAILNQSAWKNKYSADLLREECELRFAGNLVLHANTATLSVLEFWNYYNDPQRKSVFIPALKKGKKPGAGPRTLDMELFIDMDMFNERLSPDTGSKRHRESTEEPTSTVRRSKRFQSTALTASTNLPMSRFSGLTSGSRGPAAQWREVLLVQADVVYDQETGTVDIIWPSEEALGPKDLLEGKICVNILASGAGKVVYNAVLGPSAVVAKCAKIDDPMAGSLSELGALEVLEHEATANAQGNGFRDGFVELAGRKGVEVFSNFEFTQFKLCRELEELKELGKDADGRPFYQYGKAWLIEPRRAVTTEKFSGTLDHPPPRNRTLRTNTIHAFIHYIYMQANQDLIYTDVQGTEARLTSGNEGFVLFDPMVQTVDAGLRGPGDHGKAGINKWITAHKAVCGPLCRRLGLPLLKNITINDAGDGTADGDEAEHQDDE